MTGIVAALGAAVNPSLQFNGALSFSGAPVANIVTGPTRTVDICPFANRTIAFQSCSMGGTVTVQYSKNGAAFSSLLWDNSDTLNFTAITDTLAIRITNAVAGESISCNILDSNTGKVIEAFSLTAT